MLGKYRKLEGKIDVVADVTNSVIKGCEKRKRLSVSLITQLEMCRLGEESIISSLWSDGSGATGLFLFCNTYFFHQ